MNVTWSRTAIRHLTDIYDHIARDSARYAERMVDRITTRSIRIGDFPELAPVVAEYAEPNVREVLEGPYRVIYRIQPDVIVVFAVVHGAQLLPPELPDDD